MSNAFLDAFLIAVVNVDGGNHSSKAPDGDSQFICVEEVVEESVDKIAEKSECGSNGQYLGLFVLATAVGLEAAVYRHDDKS